MGQCLHLLSPVAGASLGLGPGHAGENHEGWRPPQDACDVLGTHWILRLQAFGPKSLWMEAVFAARQAFPEL